MGASKAAEAHLVHGDVPPMHRKRDQQALAGPCELRQGEQLGVLELLKEVGIRERDIWLLLAAVQADGRPQFDVKVSFCPGQDVAKHGILSGAQLQWGGWPSSEAMVRQAIAMCRAQLGMQLLHPQLVCSVCAHC